MSRKRTSLDAILDLPPAEPTVAPAPPAEPASRRPEVKQQTVYLPLATYEQLRRLAGWTAAAALPSKARDSRRTSRR